jgi:hypothetical protein
MRWFWWSIEKGLLTSLKVFYCPSTFIYMFNILWV